MILSEILSPERERERERELFQFSGSDASDSELGFFIS